MTESTEVRLLRKYLADSGVPHRVTSTNDGSHVTGSYHYRAGTEGTGLALDAAALSPSRDSDVLLAVYKALEWIGPRCAELIYAGPHGGFWKAGRQVGPYAAANHHDHVHIAVPLGTFVHWPKPGSPIIVTDFPNGEDMLRRFDLSVPTDANGNGWTIVDVPADRVVSIVANGPYPPVDGYWNLPVVARQMRDGKTVISITEGLPSVNVDLVVWTTG